MGGDAVAAGEPAGRRELDAMPLAVVEGDGVNGPSPPRKEREAGAAVEPSGEKQNGGPSAPGRRIGDRRRRSSSKG